mgnify:FL=1
MPIYSPHSSSAVTVTHTATGTIQGTNATAFTFSGLDIYATKNARKVVVAAGGQGVDGKVIASVTVAGAACILAVAATPESETNCEQWFVDLDNSTTAGNVVVTWNGGNKGNCGCDVFVLEGAAQGGPSQVLTSNATAPTNDLDIAAKGAAISNCYFNTGTSSARTTTWAGLTEASDQNDTTEAVVCSASSDAFAAAQTNLTISATLSGSSSHQALVMAAYRGPYEPAYITLEASDWQGDTGSATLGSGTAILTAGDKNIRTDDALIPAGVDFDFEATFVATGTGAQIIGIADNGTATGVQQPTTANAVLNGRNAGASSRGWQNASGTVEDAKSEGWFANSVIGLSRRGATIYGMIDGSVDHTFTGATTSKAVKFFFGSSGTGAWNNGASNVRYRRGSGLPDVS